MLLALSLASYLLDQGYLAYLMSQVRLVWSSLSNQVEKQLADVKRDIYLHLPYQLVPEEYMEVTDFFKDWLAVNANTTMLVDGKVYQTRVQYPDQTTNKLSKLSEYNCPNDVVIFINDHIAFHRYVKTIFCQDDKILVRIPLLGYERHGDYSETYSNISLDNKPTVIVKGSYQQGSKTGIWQYRYADYATRPKARGLYDNGLRQGVWEMWVNYDKSPVYGGLYVNGQEHGQWSHYSNSNVKYIANFDHGQQLTEWKDVRYDI